MISTIEIRQDEMAVTMIPTVTDTDRCSPLSSLVSDLKERDHR